jgi:hypothetical protein
VTAAVLALAATAAGNAYAAKTTLRLETAAGPLAAGAEITLGSSDLTLAKEDGAIGCESTVLNGTVTANMLKKDALSIESGSMIGRFTEESCEDTDPQGPAKMSVQDLPWPVTLAVNGKGLIKGSTKVVLNEIQIFFGPSTCRFVASKVSFTFGQVTATPEPLTLQFSEAPFKLDKKASPTVCSGTGKLVGTLSATSNGETVLAHVM